MHACPSSPYPSCQPSAPHQQEPQYSSSSSSRPLPGHLPASQHPAPSYSSSSCHSPP
uniref:Uncharacterized protein n=1 Tax=Arundo donax TaxID=35708 RepID=A0A0A9G2N4_ARUDO